MSKTFQKAKCPKTLRVAIVGYGTGGQAAALMLSADGHEVDVFERTPVLGPVGAGFLLQLVGLAVLWELGLLDAVPSSSRHGYRLRLNPSYKADF